MIITPALAPAPLFEHHTTSLVFNDPPRHTRVRRLIMGALTRRAIGAMEPGLAALVDSLLDCVEARGGGEPLPEAELLQNCIFILNAGHETTTNLIGNALVAPQEWPGVKHQLLPKLEHSAQNPQ